MNVKTLNNKGFSLIELMVVVAIIGILAAVAVPSISKYTAKSRQAEAKTQLSGLFTSTKAFHSEYGIYSGHFAVIGFGPEGDMKYNVGFSAVTADAALTAAGYSLAAATVDVANTSAWCGIGRNPNPAVPNGTGPNEKCDYMPTGGNANAQVVAAAVQTNIAFTAAAIGIIRDGAPVADRWTIDENKVIRQTADGVN
jgi:type IV pilus assembly protein PilA